MLRRDLLVMGGLLGVAAAVPPILRRIPSEFEFQPLPGFEGFRRLEGGAVSGGLDPFLGLSETDTTASRRYDFSDPCRALFGTAGWRTGAVPIAFFTDVNCPYCKVLEDRLMRLRDADDTLDLFWHEMPLLGPSSVRAARATLAARTLGAEDAVRAYLASNQFPPGPIGLTRLAEAVGLAPSELIRSEASARVSNMLGRSLSLGRALGIFGTPGTVVGRTLVVGAIRPPDLKKLIELERSGPPATCT